MTREPRLNRSALSRVAGAATRPYMLVLLAALSFAGMGLSLRKTLATIDLAVDRVALIPLGVSLFLCVAYRVINAYGWPLTVNGLGDRIGAVAGIRIWLISESCRWIPGSVWGFGSRAVLAAHHGLGPAVAGASVLMEMLLTVAGWVLVALTGWFFLPGLLDVVAGSPRVTLVVGGIGMLAVASLPLCWVLLSRSSRIKGLVERFRRQALMLKQVRPDGVSLMVALFFYTAMAVVNGLVFAVVLSAVPGGTGCPIRAAVAANAIAWLVGFFAIFAPGGLIVREACLAALLTPWIPLPQAVMIAVLWRTVQIMSEICCALTLWGHAVIRARRPADGARHHGFSEMASRDTVETLGDRRSLLVTGAIAETTNVL